MNIIINITIMSKELTMVTMLGMVSISSLWDFCKSETDRRQPISDLIELTISHNLSLTGCIPVLQDVPGNDFAQAGLKFRR